MIVPNLGKYPICSICARLWKEYADAVDKQTGLDSALQKASLQRDENVGDLIAEVETADLTRLTAKDAFWEHERSVHLEKIEIPSKSKRNI
jgi:hypothetical protein